MSEKLVLPNLIIAGVNKAGTTSLFSYLAQHPDICPATKKELCFYLPLRHGKPTESLVEYSQYFQECSRQMYRMESTPGYFYGAELIPQAIQRDLGKIKIIIILRKPISRLFSFYKCQKSMMELDYNLDFTKYVRQCEAMPRAETAKKENNRYRGIEGGFYTNYL